MAAGRISYNTLNCAHLALGSLNWTHSLAWLALAWRIVSLASASGSTSAFAHRGTARVTHALSNCCRCCRRCLPLRFVFIVIALVCRTCFGTLSVYCNGQRWRRNCWHLLPAICCSLYAVGRRAARVDFTSECAAFNVGAAPPIQKGIKRMGAPRDCQCFVKTHSNNVCVRVY